MFKFDVYFEILKFTFKKVYNSVADMVSFAPQFKQKKIKKLQLTAKRFWMLYVQM